MQHCAARDVRRRAASQHRLCPWPSRGPGYCWSAMPHIRGGGQSVARIFTMRLIRNRTNYLHHYKHSTASMLHYYHNKKKQFPSGLIKFSDSMILS